PPDRTRTPPHPTGSAPPSRQHLHVVGSVQLLELRDVGVIHPWVGMHLDLPHPTVRQRHLRPDQPLVVRHQSPSFLPSIARRRSRASAGVWPSHSGPTSASGASNRSQCSAL